MHRYVNVHFTKKHVTLRAYMIFTSLDSRSCVRGMSIFFSNYGIWNRSRYQSLFLSHFNACFYLYIKSIHSLLSVAVLVNADVHEGTSASRLSPDLTTWRHFYHSFLCFLTFHFSGFLFSLPLTMQQLIRPQQQGGLLYNGRPMGLWQKSSTSSTPARCDAEPSAPRVFRTGSGAFPSSSLL